MRTILKAYSLFFFCTHKTRRPSLYKRFRTIIIHTENYVIGSKNFSSMIRAKYLDQVPDILYSSTVFLKLISILYMPIFAIT